MEKQDLMCTLFTDSELEVMKRLRGSPRPSDHVPVTATLEL